MSLGQEETQKSVDLLLNGLKAQEVSYEIIIPTEYEKESFEKGSKEQSGRLRDRLRDFGQFLERLTGYNISMWNNIGEEERPLKNCRRRGQSSVLTIYNIAIRFFTGICMLPFSPFILVYDIYRMHKEDLSLYQLSKISYFKGRDSDLDVRIPVTIEKALNELSKERLTT
jgi:hypothetical protein